MVTLPFATMPGAMAAEVASADTVIHAWDVARATGQGTRFAEYVSRHALGVAHQVITDDFRGPDTFGPAVTAPTGSCAADELAAFGIRRSSAVSTSCQST